MSQIPTCNSGLLVQPDNSVICNQWQMIDAATLPSSFDISMLDPAIIANAFGAGFIFVGSVWLIGWSVRVILNLINRG
jgi:hypothetical protein